APPGVDMAALLAKAVNDVPPPPGLPLSPRATPQLPIAETVKRAAALANALEKRGAPPEVVQKLRALATNPDLKKLAPTLDPLHQAAPEGPGETLSGRDFTGRDLRGIDLRGANLQNAIFTRANLQGALLQAATLAGAVLAEADLSNAN